MANKTINTKFGDNIRLLRKQKGWTQIEFAQKLGCSQAIITAYENNVRKPPADKLTVIAELFGVNVTKLFGTIPKTKKNENVKNPKLLRKFEQLEQLPANDKRAVFKMIDGLLTQNKQK